MNHRTLKKEHSIHVLIWGCMVLSWGLTSYYFDSFTPNEVVSSLGDLLLFPVRFSEHFFNTYCHINITGHPLCMFLLLWITYSIPALQFYPVLIVKTHRVSDLKNWYNEKMQFPKYS